jgi:hypothetical protein
MLRRLCVVTALFGAAVIFMSASPAFAATTVGQASGNAICNFNDVIFQTGGSVSYAVPTGHWTVTSWSTMANDFGGEMALVVLRPIGGGNYQVVFAGPAEELTPNSLNTFGVSAAVQGGDIIGFWALGGTNCALFSDDSGDTYSFPASPASSEPSAGDTFAAGSGAGFLMDISATLSGGAGAVIPQVDNVYVCYSKYEQDGGAVFPAAQAAALIAEGAWLPSAVAGNIDGGDNIGAYHLECNPPSNLQPTGMYVGLGGDVVSSDIATTAKLGYYAIVA